LGDDHLSGVHRDCVWLISTRLVKDRIPLRVHHSIPFQGIGSLLVIQAHQQMALKAFVRFKRLSHTDTK
jgi:hypothetical protein